MSDIVSIIMPVHNAEKYIKESIESVIKQTYSQWELIIVNDASTDNSKKIIKEYLPNKKIKLIDLSKNSGVSVARNTGILNAKGNIIAFLDADDIWNPLKLEKQMKLLKNKEVNFVYTGVSYINEEGKDNSFVLRVPPKINYKQLLKQNIIACSSVLIKKEFLINNNMPGDYMHEDYATWLTILKKEKFAFGIDEPLLKYRISSNSKSSNKIKACKMNWNTYRHLNLNVFQTIYYMTNYILKNLKKYRKIKKGRQ